MHLDSIWLYPCKGMAGQSCTQSDVVAGQLLPGDRQFALISEDVALGHRAIDEWQPKRYFRQLLNSEKLAQLGFSYEPHTNQITISEAGTAVLCIDANQKHKLSQLLAERYTDIFASPPQFTSRTDGGGYTDTETPYISIVSRASLHEFARATGTEPDSRRFRLNLVIDGPAPFAELEWAGKMLKIGDVTIELVTSVQRCAAINIDPEHAKKDGQWYQKMPALFGHCDMGMFAIIRSSGRLYSGQTAELI